MTANLLTLPNSRKLRKTAPGAGLYLRFCAYVLDAALVLGIAFFLAQLVSLPFGLEGQTLGWLIALFALVLFLLNGIFLPIGNGQSIGKKLVGIRIVPTEAGETLDTVTLIKRHLLGYALSSLGLFGFIAIFLDSESQGWHDKIARTRVVENVQRKEDNLYPSIVSSLIVHGLLAGAFAVLALVLPLIFQYIKIPLPNLAAKEVPPPPLEYTLIDEPNKLGERKTPAPRRANVSSNAGGQRDPRRVAATGVRGAQAPKPRPQPTPPPRQAARPEPQPEPDPTPPRPRPRPRPIPREVDAPLPKQEVAKLPPVRELTPPDPTPTPQETAPAPAPTPTRRTRRTRSSSSDSVASRLGGPLSVSGGNGGIGDSGDFSPDRSGPGRGVDADADVDFGPYMAALKRRVRRNWFAPETGNSRRTVLEFSLDRRGRLQEVRVARSSGSPNSDQSAIEAVRAAAPFGTLPPSYKGERIDIRFTFDVNVFGGDISDF